ncbi:MAG: NnrU family protein [Proteobacteria bacterium]|nr:NnrU family protein [Pseudomonadota bacterium]
MDLLTFGLILFFALHTIPFFPRLRNRLYERFGEKAWKIGYSLVALTGLVIIGFGYANAPYEPLWSFPKWGSQLTIYAMAPAFILMAAGNLKGHIRKILRHPMLIGFFIWGAGHMLANGDLASTKLFGAFAVFSLAAIVSAEARNKVSGHTPTLSGDFKAIFGGLVIYAVVFFAHGWLFGAPLG